jgi:hypothetical protein
MSATRKAEKRIAKAVATQDRKAITRAVKKSSKKVLKKEEAAMWLSRGNDYWDSIRDPFTHPGAQIPDMTTYPSTTVQSVTRFTLVPNAAGLCGVVAPLRPNVAYETLASTATKDIFTYDTPASISGVGSFNTLYTKFRVVSAGLTVQYDGNNLTNKGRVLLSQVPRYGAKDTIPAFGALIELMNQPILARYPVAKRNFTVTYIPTDNKNLEYQTTGVGGASTDSYYPGAISFYADGLDSSAVFDCALVINYECIPASSAVNLVQPKISKCDPIGLAEAFNNSADHDPFSLPGKLASSIMPLPSDHAPNVGPSHSHETHRGKPVARKSTMEMITGFLDKVPVKEIASIAAMLL